MSTSSGDSHDLESYGWQGDQDLYRNCSKLVPVEVKSGPAYVKQRIGMSNFYWLLGLLAGSLLNCQFYVKITGAAIVFTSIIVSDL